MNRSEFTAALRDMNPTELDARIAQIRADIMHERSELETLGMTYGKDRHNSYQNLKKDLARALTIQAEKRREN